MEILRFPHPNLFEKCAEVTVFGLELKILLEAMWETMISSNGLGLAANQVGLNYRMFTMLGPNNEKFFIINPKILAISKVSANLKEGCLSAPGEFLILKERPKWIELEFQDELGIKHNKVFEGIYSVCVFHEYDHLDGKSFLESKSIPRNKRKELCKKWGLKV